MSFPYFVCSSLLCLLCRGWQPWSHLKTAWLARQAPVAPDCRGWRRLYHVPDRTKNSLTAQALLLIIEKRECQCSSVVEQLIRNQQVSGSSPLIGSTVIEV